MPSQWTVVIRVTKLRGYVTWHEQCIICQLNNIMCFCNGTCRRWLLPENLLIQCLGEYTKLTKHFLFYFFGFRWKPNCLLPTNRTIPIYSVHEIDSEIYKDQTAVYDISHEISEVLSFCFTPAIDCPTLKSPAGGRIRGSGNAFGTVLRFECDSGLQLEGSIERRCMENGEWSGTEVECTGTIKWNKRSWIHWYGTEVKCSGTEIRSHYQDFHGNKCKGK